MVHLCQSLAVSNLTHWNAEPGVNISITLKECNGISQHCPFMISSSKQEKCHINNNLQLFHKGELGSFNFIALSCIHKISFKLKSKHELLKIRYP